MGCVEKGGGFNQLQQDPPTRGRAREGSDTWVNEFCESHSGGDPDTSGYHTGILLLFRIG